MWKDQFQLSIETRTHENKYRRSEGNRAAIMPWEGGHRRGQNRQRVDPENIGDHKNSRYRYETYRSEGRREEITERTRAGRRSVVTITQAHAIEIWACYPPRKHNLPGSSLLQLEIFIKCSTFHKRTRCIYSAYLSYYIVSCFTTPCVIFLW